jgi:hypothetical protein
VPVPAPAASTTRPTNAAGPHAERENPPPAGGFDPRALTASQLDELAHRLIGRITGLLRPETVTKLVDPRELTARQLDELTHRLIDRITRLLRAELRLDRERIGRLRDTRH